MEQNLVLLWQFMNADESDYPQFGDANTDPIEVVQGFYGFWQSYSTKRSYVWKEEYDTREAPNRWVRRKMEQENNKVTEQASFSRFDNLIIFQECVVMSSHFCMVFANENFSLESNLVSKKYMFNNLIKYTPLLSQLRSSYKGEVAHIYKAILKRDSEMLNSDPLTKLSKGFYI